MHNSHKIRTSIAGAVIAFVGFTQLTACSLSVDDMNCEFKAKSASHDLKQEVAVVQAPTNNFNDFEKVYAEAKTNIQQSIQIDGSKLSVIVADAQPKTIATEFVEKKDLETEFDVDVKAKRAAGSALRVSTCVVADGNPLAIESQTDTLYALNAAAESFESDSSKKTIFVLSNGIQTTGQYPMQTRGIPSIEQAAEVVQQLKDQGALPDLKGATVNWVGLGETDGVVQRELNQQTVDALEYFWTMVIQASNGVVGSFDREVIAGKPHQNAITTQTISGLQNACFFKIDSDAGFNFKPDSSEFTDLETATSSAKRIAEEVQQSGCDSELHVTGYVASGTSKDNFDPALGVQLSLERAEKFKQLLIQEGITGSVTAHGGGKGPENDWNPDGSFNEEAGKLNRVVVITQ